jgi:tRNA-dihydrouridine synthase B
MLEVGEIKIKKALLLAPMEDVTSIPFRILCKELGADVVYTEFVNSDGLVRENLKTEKKMDFLEEERPLGIQIYGGNLEPMIESAKISESKNPDLIDINAGCWVKKVATRGAGAGLLKDPDYLVQMSAEVVKAVEKPVTVKTRIGWDTENIVIVDIAKRLQDVGVKALTIHCRTRQMGHKGDPMWEWITRVKEEIDIPVVLNGGVFTAEDAKRAFDETNADGVMIARGAIDHPWIFRETKELLQFGEVKTELTPDERIHTALKHLRYELKFKEKRRAIIPFRKYYSGYLKGLYASSLIRQQLMKHEDYAPIEDLLLGYLEDLKHFPREDHYSPI